MKKNNRPQIGVGIIVKKKNKILLLKRKGSHGHGQWSLPGGYQEFGERLKDCAVREVKEETGLVINKAELQFVSLSEQLDYFQTDNKHCLTVGFVIDYQGSQEPEIKEPDKSSAIGWFDLDQLPADLFAPSRDNISNFKNKLVYK